MYKQQFSYGGEGGKERQRVGEKEREGERERER